MGGEGAGLEQALSSISAGSPCLSPGAPLGFREGESVSVMLRLESRYLLSAGRAGLKVGRGRVRGGRALSRESKCLQWGPGPPGPAGRCHLP